jgi:D-sedoheptulose 7-phosphate isomerase|tara:strand:+ start:10426 stop:11016 length:591 start_codon:yes stop_codon:yes gene_type:complete
MSKNSLKIRLKKAALESSILKKNLIKKDFLINKAVFLLSNALKSGNKIMICGNGGSAADAQHLSAEFLVRLKPGINRKPFPVMSLAMDTSTLTACGNDYNFNKIFERNLDAFGSSGDILLAISTSGNSTNVINAIKLAKRRKIKTIGFLGFNGGKAKKILDLAITVNNKNVARIQEAHIFLGHFIFEEVESLLIYK